MIHVAVVSMKGGTGRTTVAANLVAELARRGAQLALPVDFDPRNQLGLHFGMGLEELATGLSDVMLEGGPCQLALRRAKDRSLMLPFGAVDEVEQAAFERGLADKPALLGDSLAPLGPSFAFAILDVAAGPSTYLRHALEMADVALVVLLPDAACLATLPAMEARIEASMSVNPRLAAQFVINDVDESRALGRDIRAVFSTHCRAGLGTGAGDAPLVIHHDQAIREALALQKPLIEHSPASQAVADFRTLGDWLCAKVL